jgi:hypothetical protein
MPSTKHFHNDGAPLSQLSRDWWLLFACGSHFVLLVLFA